MLISLFAFYRERSDKAANSGTWTVRAEVNHLWFDTAIFREMYSFV